MNFKKICKFLANLPFLKCSADVIHLESIKNSIDTITDNILENKVLPKGICPADILNIVDNLIIKSNPKICKNK